MQIIYFLKATPFWVYLLFGYLIFRGIKASKQTVILPSRLFIAPVVFLLLYIKGFSNNVQNLTLFCILLIISTIINWRFFDKPLIQVNNNLIIIPGSWQPLILIIIIFSIKYFFGYMRAVNLELAQKYKIMELIISSWVLGVMFFKAIYCYSYANKINNQKN
ncbi:hypothetical protein [Candidatus Tisiphia endosymbiont of Ditula angustiorana]|uniref:hypothetical protein n=1 Tax=Candidatus Tisiphia endosymbiont of Ditula angustiorana TaxID=3066272 RepID=UPI00312CBF3A